MRRAQHGAEGHARQRDVVDVAPAALEQPRIFEPCHALANRKLAHPVSFFARVALPAAAARKRIHELAPAPVKGKLTTAQQEYVVERLAGFDGPGALMRSMRDGE